jgi:hypothetical protein
MRGLAALGVSTVGVFTTIIVTHEERVMGNEASPGPVRYARTATTITAAHPGRLGKGRIVLLDREGDETRATGEEATCYSPYRCCVCHPCNLIVAHDGADYVLVGADLERPRPDLL